MFKFVNVLGSPRLRSVKDSTSNLSPKMSPWNSGSGTYSRGGHCELIHIRFGAGYGYGY